MTGATQGFLEATVRTATPLALAALGELVVELTGVINIGLEGVILGGAYAAVVGGAHGTIAGYASGMVTGMAVAALFAVTVLWLRSDQVIAGTAITLLAAGATGTLYRVMYGATGAALSVPTSSPIPVPLLARIPLIGPALFDQPAPTYVLYALIPILWFVVHRTHVGLALRAAGENREAVEASGVRVQVLRWWALLAGGALGGLAGATLVLAQAGTFAENMSAGRGFIAIAVVVLGRWRVTGVALAALAFGAASAMQFAAQALGLDLPYQLFLALPYLLTLAALAGVGGRARAPAQLGRTD